MSVIPNKYLQTNLNRLQAGPAALLKANNVRIDGMRLRSRIGQELLVPEDPPLISLISSYAGYRMKKIFWYNNRIWAYFRDEAGNDPDAIGYFDQSTNTWFASLFSAQDFWSFNSVQLPQITESNRRLFFASSDGIYCSPKLSEDETIGNGLSTLQTDMRYCGVPRQTPFISAVTVDTAASYASNWLDPLAEVSYRGVWKYTDANGIEVYGPVSDMIRVANPSSTLLAAVELEWYIPIEVAAGGNDTSRYAFELYRTKQSLAGPGNIVPDPGDENFKVAEIRPTFSDIGVGSMTFIDIIPDDALQEPLYTNSTQEGASQSRVRPPKSKTIEDFAGCLFFGNTTERWSLPFEVVAVEDTTAPTRRGLRVNDILIIGDRVFQAKTAVQIAGNDFVLTGTAGVTESLNRIFSTIHSLVNVYNSELGRNRFDLDSITDPDGFTGNLVLREIYDGSTTSGFTPYIGIYRENGWNAVAADDPCPIVPAPIVGFNASNEVIGRGFKLTRIRCTGVGAAITFTLSSAPDFLVKDIVNVARPMNLSDGSLPVGSQGDGIQRFTPGQYEVATISGSDVTLTGVTGSAAFDVQIGVAPFATVWTNLGGMHCIKSDTLGAVSAGVGKKQVFSSRLYYSPFQEPEAAPVFNYFDVGNTDREIIRIIRLNESLFVFKQDGLFRVRGEFPNFFIEQFDKDIILSATDAVTSLGGNLYALTTRGIYQISETSAERISYDIQNQIDKLLWQNASTVQSTAFAVSNEGDHSVSFWIADNCFVYDGEGWTKRTDQSNYAASGRDTEDSSDVSSLYVAKDLGSGWMTKSRHNFNGIDYCDEQFNITFAQTSGIAATQIKVNIANDAAPAGLGSSFAQRLVGAVLVADNGYSSRAVVTASTWLTADQYTLDLEFIDSSFDTGDWPQAPADILDIYLPINQEWQYGLMASDDPTARRHFSEVSIVFQQPYISKMDVGFSSDVNPAQTWLTSNIQGFISANPEPTEWQILADDTVLQDKVIKAVVATQHARCSQLRVSFRLSRAMEFLSVYGYFLRFADGGKTIERSNG